MKSALIGLLAILTSITTICKGQDLGTMRPAFSVEFQAEADKLYTLERSDSVDGAYTAFGEPLIGDDSTRKLFFDGDDAQFAKVTERAFMPKERILGLTRISTDATSASFEGSRMILNGVRAEGNEIDLDDYLQIEYEFDAVTQCFTPTNIVSFQDIGPTCGITPLFFLKDITQAPVISVAEDILANELQTFSLDLTTPKNLTLKAQKGTIVEFKITQRPAPFIITIEDPDGDRVFRSSFPDGLGTWYTAGIELFKTGDFALKFEELEQDTSPQLQLSFKNLNSRTTKIITDGSSISSSITDFFNDYDKFRLSLQANRRVSFDLPGSSAEKLTICNSSGKEVTTLFGSGPAFFLPPETDDYFIIYSANNFSANNWITSFSFE